MDFQKYCQLLSFSAVLYLSILSLYAFTNSRTMKLDPNNYMQTGITFLITAGFYLVCLIFVSFINCEKGENSNKEFDFLTRQKSMNSIQSDSGSRSDLKEPFLLKKEEY